VKRRLKAAASIGLAIIAGVFLACTPTKQGKEKARVPVPPNPMTPSAGAVPSTASSTKAASADSAGGGSSVSAGSTAVTPAVKGPHKAPSVDKQEHRKGMPVPDNLLE
jgi:hypothetical protein